MCVAGDAGAEGSSYPRRSTASVAPRVPPAKPRRCDEQVLPAVYRYIGASWDASPTQLGYITLSRALVQALTAPVGGIAGVCAHGPRLVHSRLLLNWLHAICTPPPPLHGSAHSAQATACTAPACWAPAAWCGRP